MSKQPRNTNSKHEKPPKLVGVHIRSREEHWGELLGSVDSAEAEFNDGRFMPEHFITPRPRMQPVYETADGRRVVLEPTSDGFTVKSYPMERIFEGVKSGGIDGGFMLASLAPPLPIAGGASAAAWAGGCMYRVPEHVELVEFQGRWGPSTKDYVDAVDAKTSPELDEWRRQYFARIREAAAQRDPIYRSPTAEARGANYFTKEAAWGAEEYHGDLFKAYADAAEKNRRDSADGQTAAPAGLFGHSSMSRMLALAGTIQKNGPGLPVQFYQALEPAVSDRMGKALLAHIRDQAQVPGGKGPAVDQLRGAFDLLKKLNDAGDGKLLAGMLGNLAGGKGSDLDMLKGNFIKNLAKMGLDQGLEKLMGKEAAGPLAGVGVTGLFADTAKNLAMGLDSGFAAGAEKLLDDLPNKLVDMGMDKLIGKVDDRSSMAKQLLAKYQDQIKDLLKKLLSGDAIADLQKRWDAIWKGMPSKACVPMGLAIGFCEADLVMINGLPATRFMDECLYPPPEPPGKFFQFNPTITINGQHPSGAIHAAINGKGTIATPMEISPNVLIGEATVSVRIKVKMETPTVSAGSSTGSGGGASKHQGDGLARSGKAGDKTAANASSTENAETDSPSTHKTPQTVGDVPPTDAERSTPDVAPSGNQNAEASTAEGEESPSSSGLLGGDHAEIRQGRTDEERTIDYIKAASAYSDDPQKQWEYLTELRNRYDIEEIRNDPALVNAQHFIVGRNLTMIFGSEAPTWAMTLGYEGLKAIGAWQLAQRVQNMLEREQVHIASDASWDAVIWALTGSRAGAQRNREE